MPFDSGSPELNFQIQQWLDWDQNIKTLDEIKALIAKKEWDTLRLRLSKRLTFGTAGLRGPMRAGNDSMNDLVVIQTAQGLRDYLSCTFPTTCDREERGVVFGYDGRYNSKQFAELSACVFLRKGFKVYLFSEMVPTPFIPFAIKQKNCLAGVMVTASHNPKEDNGYKVYWSNSCQIIPPHDVNIQNSIERNLSPNPAAWDTSILKTTAMLEDPYCEIFDKYFEKLQNNIPQTYLDANDRSAIKFVYTAMHGVGYPFIQQAFKVANLLPPLSVQEQEFPDPEFSTVKYPNPEEGKSSLDLAIKKGDDSMLRIILANDPDADRLAVAEKNKQTNRWKIFTGDEIGALLGWWALHCFKEDSKHGNICNCYMLASTVSSKILKTMAEEEGFNFEETLTGFKWLGNRAVELIDNDKTVLFAFEEAIGFMFSSTVLDKDGVSAACHLATMACALDKCNITLQEKLDDLYDIYGYHLTNNSYLFCYDPEVIVKIFDRLRKFDEGKENTYPENILDGKYRIKYVRDLTTGIDTSRDDGKATLPVSSSTQMITFTFENGLVITLRTSGTEPKLKYYAELCAKPTEKDVKELRTRLNEMVEAIVEEFLQPDENKLVYKDE